MSDIVKATLREAKDIPEGGFFTKRTGTFAYLRVSDSAANFLKLDANYIYGVAYNGNMARVKRDCIVAISDLHAMVANQQSEDLWNDTFAKEGWRDEV